MWGFWQGLPNNTIHSTFDLLRVLINFLYHFLKKLLNFQIISDHFCQL